MSTTGGVVSFLFVLLLVLKLGGRNAIITPGRGVSVFYTYTGITSIHVNIAHSHNCVRTQSYQACVQSYVYGYTAVA